MLNIFEIALILLFGLVILVAIIVKTHRWGRLSIIGIFTCLLFLIVLVIFLTRLVFGLFAWLLVTIILILILVYAMTQKLRDQ